MIHAGAKNELAESPVFLLKICCTGFFLGDTKQ